MEAHDARPVTSLRGWRARQEVGLVTDVGVQGGTVYYVVCRARPVVLEVEEEEGK
jgi:hypothetical protein